MEVKRVNTQQKILDGEAGTRYYDVSLIPRLSPLKRREPGNEAIMVQEHIEQAARIRAWNYMKFETRQNLLL